jgi:hypothetical protein
VRPGLQLIFSYCQDIRNAQLGDITSEWKTKTNKNNNYGNEK